MILSVKDIFDYNLLAEDGEAGKVKDALFDESEWIIRYLVVETGGWLSGRNVLIPPSVLGAPDTARKEFPVSLTRDQIGNSPQLESGASLTRSHEEDLYRHYGWEPYWVPEDAMGPLPGTVMVESGEQLAESEAAVAEAERRAEPRLRSVKEMMGFRVDGPDGKLGKVDSFLMDDESWDLRYIILNTGNWLKSRLVPLSVRWLTALDWDRHKVAVDLSKKDIHDSPEWDESMPMPRQYEVDIHSHYGRTGYWEET